MTKETKTHSTSSVRACQNCKQNFTIEPEDFNFYEKIKVPPPTWCPECRLIRRLQWRNEHSLFRRANGTPGAKGEHISIYHPDEKIVTYDREYWWGDKWDPCDYAQDYDFSRPFFEQFKKLFYKVPHICLFDSRSVNSRFCNIVVGSKNAYLVTASWEPEDSMYCNRTAKCKFMSDSYTCFSCEFGYEDMYCRDSSRLFLSRECENCLDSYFLYDCRNCANCILCTNLRNKSYCIENVQYTKEEYEKKKEELRLNTRTGIGAARIKFEELWRNAVHKHLKMTNTVNVLGDHVRDSRNCHAVFDIAGSAENSKYSSWAVEGLKDSYDVGPGSGESELMYEGISVGVEGNRNLFCVLTWYSSDIFYSYMINNSINCFGCVGLNKKQYCILNKQYTKEDYKKLIPKIIEHMKKTEEYGEFFSPELSPFAYNEAISQDYFPLTSKAAKAKGFRWREYKGGEYKTTIKGKNLPQIIAEVGDDILNEVIECEVTKKPFKITEQELSFYRRFNLPLPSVHPDERHNRRLRLRNPMVLRKRMCYFGDKEVITTYLPVEEGGPEKVVCTEHYNKEIY